MWDQPAGSKSVSSWPPTWFCNVQFRILFSVEVVAESFLGGQNNANSLFQIPPKFAESYLMRRQLHSPSAIWSLSWCTKLYSQYSQLYILSLLVLRLSIVWRVYGHETPTAVSRGDHLYIEYKRGTGGALVLWQARESVNALQSPPC